MSHRKLITGLFAAAMILVAAFFLSARLASAVQSAEPPSVTLKASPLAPPQIPAEGAYVGVYLQDAALDHCAAIIDFTARTGKAHAIYSRYVSINDGEDWWSGMATPTPMPNGTVPPTLIPNRIADFMACVKAAGGIPMLIFEFARPLTPDGLAEGDVRWLEQAMVPNIRDFGDPVFVNFAPEMNLKENKGQGSLALAVYQAAYRVAFCQVKQILREIGADNAATVWSPNQKWANPDPAWDYELFYPGDDCVDWVGLDYYLHKDDFPNREACDLWLLKAALNGSEYNNYFYERFSAPTPRAIFTPARTVTPHGKPMMIPETGASDLGPCGQNWYIDRLYSIYVPGSSRLPPYIDKEFPNLHGIVWFNRDKTPDATHPWEEPWTIRDYDHYATAIAPDYFIGADTPTPTPTATATATNTRTATPTATSTPTPTFTATPTASPTNTPTPTPTATNTATSTDTATSTVTSTATPTATRPPSGEGDPYEDDDTCAHARSIPTGGTAQDHTFHKAGDADWIVFSATAGVLYRIEVVPSADSPADVDLELYDSCNGVPAESWFRSFTPGVRLNYAPPTSGPLYLRLSNHDALVTGEHVRYGLTVRALLADAPSRGLIIAAGRLKGADAVQTNIHYVADHVHALFLANGYTEEMIQYLATDASRPGYDAALTSASLRNSIRTWAVQNITGEGVLNLYLIDHGRPDIFYLDEITGQRLTPEELAAWLNDFEVARPGVRINVFIEACDSGSFIEGAPSISKAGRVIVTSTNAAADAWTIPGAGAHFSDYFLTGLMQGRDIFTSFWSARTAAQFAHATQDAWLDANGNRITNELEDGVIAAQRSFAYANTLAPEEEWPPHIFSVTAQGSINHYRGSFRADVRDDMGVALVWAVVYPPDYDPPPSNQQLRAETLPTFLLTSGGTNSIYEGVYTGFTQRGLYRIVIYARDGQGLVARPVEVFVNTGSRVYLPLMLR